MWTQCTSVTDRRTDGRTDGQNYDNLTKTVQRIASHGKNPESHRGSHRKDMSPLTQGLNYRSACEIAVFEILVLKHGHDFNISGYVTQSVMFTNIAPLKSSDMLALYK